MTIRSLDKYLAALWDWGILDGCFGRSRIRPSDIDGVVDRHGQFLLLEAKTPGKPIDTGQEMLFEALRRTGLWTILVVWGPQNTPVEMMVWTAAGRGRKRPATLADVRRAVSAWFAWADTHGHKHGLPNPLDELVAAA